MKWTRQRCQIVLSTFDTAALMPSATVRDDQPDTAQATACVLT